MPASADARLRDLLRYIADDVLGGTEPSLAADTPLFSSGLIDSMAIVDVLQKIEQIMNVTIPAGRLRLKDVDTAEMMIAAAERHGRRRPD